MPKLPRVKPKQLIAALQRAGFIVDHITGSHYILYKDDHTMPISVPYHNRDIKLGTMSAIRKQAGLTVKGLITLLHR